MIKKSLLCLLACLALLLASCGGGNEYGLVFNSDSSDKTEYIYYDNERVVYVIGGLMMIDVDGEAKMLEMAFKDGDVTIDDILASAEKDVEKKKITATDYPDGSREYHYEGFDIVKLNTHLGNRDVYFVPSNLGYYDVTN